MSLRVNCPSCQMPCQVAAEHLGKAIRCPGCKQPFSTRRPTPPPPPPPIPALTPPPIPQPSGTTLSPRLTSAAHTSPGRLRDRNEDSFLLQHLAWTDRDGRHELVLAVVADGMGGHQAGDRASAEAIAAIARALLPRLAGLIGGQDPFENHEAMLDVVDHALWEANRAVSEAAAADPTCEGMGATGVAALVLGTNAAICHVGDCRAYLWRNGTLELKTRDQTVVSRMVDLGMLSEKEAQRHRAAGQVTQALGRQYELEPSRQVLTLQKGDRLVLACDGLHAHLEMDALRELISAHGNAIDLAEKLVRRADDAGGSDNCTVAVVCAGSAEIGK